ncbi:N-acetylglucosamine kinase [Ornithinibacillus californiensis]|uniref:N-acetylglucosamine kinase n=1 Tax=Ornithinibacillus californiensis TaxID=161536 RepID=UPI00069D960F|nr:BadF/BadG/BcrA/BcrD ATPase family protein [Ornithinibacillus californiensis]
MRYVIGIDGGGTKTEVALADLDGNVLVNQVYGATNPNTVTKQELKETFLHIFQDIEGKVPGSLLQVSSVFAGISGAGSKASAALLEEIISPYLSSYTRLKVEVDSINALYSGTFGKPGIVQICGTGSITYGINQKKEQDRVGGWGYLLGDEGSGYEIGRKGIAAVLQYVDGRGPETKLVDLLYQHFQVTSGRELIDQVYQSESPRLVIAQVSKLVYQAYELKDQAAVEILRQTSKEIAYSIVTLHKKLFNQDEKVKVTLCGGLFNNPTILPVLIKEALADHNNHLTLVLPEVPPVAGSVIGAYIELGNTVSSAVKENLREYWKKE